VVVARTPVVSRTTTELHAASPPLLLSVSRVLKALFAFAGYGYAFWAILMSSAAMIDLHKYFPVIKQLGFRYSLDSPNIVDVGGSLLQKLAVNMATLSLFVGSHSLLARPAVKKMLGIGGMNRPVYIWVSGLTLHLVHALWQPLIGDTVWNLTGAGKTATLAGYAFGLFWLLSSTFALDHFELFGLKQGFNFDFYGALGLTGSSHAGLKARLHYAVVRHPIMFGFCMMLFSVPKMTLTHLFFSGGAAAYIVLAVNLFEEPDLRKHFGEEYKEYASKTPMFIPFAPK